MTAAEVVAAVVVAAGLVLINLVLHRRQRQAHERRLAELRLANDARERTLVEQVAQRSHHLTELERWLDGAPTALALFDRDLRFVRVNQRWADLTGVTIDAHRDRSAAELAFSYAPWSRTMPLLYRAAMDGARATSVEISGRSVRDGTARSWLFDCMPLLGDDGSIIAVSASLGDVTERAQRDAQRLYRQQMDAAARLASGIAHDFNNSFGVIAAYASMAEASGTLDAVNAARVREIVATVERAGALTRQLLAFGQPGDAIAPRVDVNGVLRRMAPLVERIVPDRIVLDMRVERELAVVAIDPDRLEQILMHLVTNAVAAMPQAGTLVVETSVIELPDEDSDPAKNAGIRGRVAITVTDTGIGMDESTLRRVFEPFFTTKPAAQGSGLGLAIVYDAVNRAGGTIRTSSEAGRGTTVRVYLPVNADHLADPSAVDETTEDARHLRILVVSDDPSLAPKIAGLLGPSGYLVRSASDRAAAMSILETEQLDIDLVLTDGSLDAEDGGTFDDAVLARYPELPMLVASAPGQLREGALGTEHCARFDLAMPCTREQLVDAIGEALNAG